MCTDEQHKEKMDALHRIERLLTHRAPQDTTVMISDTQPWKVDTRGYKHLFMWIPGASLTMNFGEYGSGPVQSQAWVNIGMHGGYDIVTVGQSSPVPIKLRFTNEVIP